MPIIGISRANLILNGAATPLLTFTDEFGPWRSATPQGVDQVLIPFEFPGAEGVLIGRNVYGDGEVDFIGLNLMFHAVTTSDPLAIRILEAELNRTANQRPDDIPVPMQNYEATEAGWSFDMELEQEGWVLFPMANHAGTRVLVDGEPVEELSIETLTLAKLPAGLHSVQIVSEETTIYTLGRAASVIGGLILVAYIVGLLRKPGVRLRRRDATPEQEPAGA